MGYVAFSKNYSNKGLANKKNLACGYSARTP